MFEASDFFAGPAVGCLIYIGLQILGNVSKRAPLPPRAERYPFGRKPERSAAAGRVRSASLVEVQGPLWTHQLDRGNGEKIIIINNWRLASQLLDKRSAKHSSRPKLMIAGEMVGWENSLGFSPYNDRFGTHRKNIVRIIGSKTAAAKYERLQEAEVAHFLLHDLDDPERFMDHIRKEAGSVILKIAYGYTAEPFNEDVLIKLAGQAMDNVTTAGVPGAFLVDILPLLRYVPD